LAIEEQFYLIWPFVIWSFSKTKLNHLFLIIPLALASFFLCQFITSADMTKAFYLPQTRIWELLIGASISAFTHNASFTFLKSRFFTLVCSSTGAVFLIYSLCIINRESVFPGNLALLPTLAMGLLIITGSHSPLNRTILSTQSLVWFGKISFPLYLWH
jgi:peptidoglycan/LPS O-acetylase OafA/YrhL